MYNIVKLQDIKDKEKLLKEDSEKNTISMEEQI